MLQKNIQNAIGQFKKSKILLVGDIILDNFIYGSVERISPEAPIPILNVSHNCFYLGGVGNVAKNIASMGANVNLLSVIGHDTTAKKITKLIDDIPNISNNILTIDGISSIKQRFVSQGQQLLRVDKEPQLNFCTKVFNEIINRFINAIESCDIVVLSDYNKGLLTYNLIKKLITIATKHNKKVIVDPKGKDYHKYSGSFLITPNKKELKIATTLPNDTDKQIITSARTLITKYKIKNVLVTKSEKGMSFINENSFIHKKTISKEVFDVSGAGDTVVATISLCLAQNIDNKIALNIANIAAGIVVQKIGTASLSTGDILMHIQQNTKHSPETKIMSLNQVIKLTNTGKQNNLKIGFTNGCFDILHSGHLKLIKEARDNCDFLIMAINSDASIKRIKGSERPFINQTNRAINLSFLHYIDAIIIFEQDTPIQLIKAIKPDVIIKGGDYQEKDVIGAEFVKSYGGKILIVDKLSQHSTTNLVRDIRNKV